MDMHRNQPTPAPVGVLPVGTNTPEGLIFPSLQRAAATYVSDEIFNPNCKGVRLYINRTAMTGTAAVSVEGRDPVTDTWFVITGATTAALTTAIGTTLTLYPGITAAAGSATTSTEVSTFLPCSWRVKIIVATDVTTLSIGGEYLL